MWCDCDGVVWCCVIWCDTVCGMEYVLCSVVWCDTVWSGMEYVVFIIMYLVPYKCVVNV